MALRDFDEIGYLPMLEVRPAEMVALQSLPEKGKDLILPLFKLRPWVAAHELKSAVARISESYGKRPSFLALGEFDAPDAPRSVHRDLDALKDSTNGFNSWCSYLEKEEHNNFIPSIQLTDATQFDAQAARLIAMGRGAMVILEAGALAFVDVIAARTAQLSNGGKDIVFLIDYGKQGSAFPDMSEFVLNHVNTILKAAQNSKIAISASSFPSSFTSISDQAIYERELFNVLQQRCDVPITYSDRGSTRAERQNGGGGAPAPRIDYATANKWFFYREDRVISRALAYQEQASKLIESPVWDSNLRVWGTQMIERTALGDDSAITSPPRSTAARINIHLHQQMYYGNLVELHDTDEDWND